MNRSKFVMNITIVGIVLMILIPTIYKIVTGHNDRLLKVTTKRIEEAAKNCKLDEKCKSKKIELRDLYEYGYLTRESNPITKEYYNESSYVEVNKNSYKFVEIK